MESFEALVTEARDWESKQCTGYVRMTLLEALEALAAERAAEREDKRGASQWTREEMAAFAAQTAPAAPTRRLPPMVRPGWTTANPVNAATARVAMARANAPEPVSVGHWGMVG